MLLCFWRSKVWSKTAGIRLDVEMPECFDERHNLFTDNRFMTYGEAAYLPKRLPYNEDYAPKPASTSAK